MDDVAVRETDVRLHHGECPVWWPDGSGLRLVDMLAGDLVTLGRGGEIVRHHVGGTVAAPRPRRGGGDRRHAGIRRLAVTAQSLRRLARSFATLAPQSTPALA